MGKGMREGSVYRAGLVVAWLCCSVSSVACVAFHPTAAAAAAAASVLLFLPARWSACPSASWGRGDDPLRLFGCRGLRIGCCERVTWVIRYFVLLGWSRSTSSAASAAPPCGCCRYQVLPM